MTRPRLVVDLPTTWTCGYGNVTILSLIENKYAVMRYREKKPFVIAIQDLIDGKDGWRPTKVKTEETQVEERSAGVP